MAFQRTRMSADRTLMAVIRTSLSLIGFGFTIFQVFQKLHDSQILKSSLAPRRFGEALVWLGITMLFLGIGYHIAFMLGLRRQLRQLKATELVHAKESFPVSLTLITAVILLTIGFMAIFGMTFQSGPFE